MLFIKRAKILSTRLYEFFEGGDIGTIATSPDKLVQRTNQATFSDLWKSGIHQAFSEFVVHVPIVAPQPLASVLPQRVAKADIGKPSITIKTSHRWRTRSECPLSANSGLMHRSRKKGRLAAASPNPIW
jgi:hypothetical protein